MKKDTSNTVVDLDALFTESKKQSITETVTEKPVLTEIVHQQQKDTVLDFDTILREWSWRCDKGYPDFNNLDDKIKLQEVLDEMNITLPFERIALSEVALSAQESEQVLVDLWNAAANGKGIPTQYKKRNFESLFRSIQSVAKAPVEIYGKKKLSTSQFWKTTTGKAVDTSKTDVLGKRHYSVKFGPAQLMSGEAKEAQATFLIASKNSGLELKAQKEVERLLTELKAKSGKTIGSDLDVGTLKKLPKEKITDTVNQKALQLIEEGERIQDTLTAYLNQLFETDEKFYLEFIFEAMTGASKFSDKNAIANSMLCINKDATAIKIHDVVNSSSTYVKTVASATDLKINYKSGSVKQSGEKVGYRFYTALRLNVKDLTKSVNEINGYLNSHKGPLNEDFWDFLKSLWSKIKEVFNKIITVISDTIIYCYKGLQYLMSAFNIEASVNGWSQLDSIDLFEV